MALHITGDDHADQVLTDDPFALLVGMLLDQQYPMEHAFRGPAKVLDRFGTLDPATIAAADPEEFAAMCATPPAIHRYGRSMAGRRAGAVADRGGHLRRRGRAAVDRGDLGADLVARVMALPGFGKQKAQIFIALLAKQLDVRPEGWEQAVGATPRTATARWPTSSTRRPCRRCATSRRPKKAAAKAATA